MVSSLEHEARRPAFDADVTFITAQELCFTFLRDQTVDSERRIVRTNSIHGILALLRDHAGKVSHKYFEPVITFGEHQQLSTSEATLVSGERSCLDSHVGVQRFPEGSLCGVPVR